MLEPILKFFFASASNITMVIYNLFKFKFKMFYPRNDGVSYFFYVKISRRRSLERRSIVYRVSPSIYTPKYLAIQLSIYLTMIGTRFTVL
jgi:hypothetical protein